MRENLEGKVSKASSLLDVLNVMKEKTMLDTHVATLAYVQEIVLEAGTEGSIYGCLRVKPFPLNYNQQEYAIQAYYFDKTHKYAVNDIVLIVFCDLNFISSLNAIDYKPKMTNDSLTHSLKYGIVIPLMASHND